MDHVLRGQNEDVEAPPTADVLVLSLVGFLWLVLLEGWLPGVGPMPDGIEAPMDAPGVPEVTALATGPDGVLAYLLMWGTMMVAMGSMNLPVMVALTVVVVLERVAPESERVARSWGVVLLAAAAFTLLFGVPG